MFSGSVVITDEAGVWARQIVVVIVNFVFLLFAFCFLLSAFCFLLFAAKGWLWREMV